MTMRHGPARTAALALTALLLAGPAPAETFLTCRFPNGGQLRVVIEEQGLAVELPGQTAWMGSEEMGGRRDPLVAGFGAPLPGDGWRGVPAHDRFALSLSRVTGEARLLFSRRPDAARVEACRAAAAPPAAGAGDQPPTPPVPCDLPLAAGSLAGTCEVQRLKF
jgi:hypothetical protein